MNSSFAVESANKVPQGPRTPKCPSVWVPKCLNSLNAQVLICLITLSARLPESFKCPNNRVPSEWSSAQLPPECSPSAQRNFRLVLTLRLNKKHSFEIDFKQIIISFQLIQWSIFFVLGQYLSGYTKTCRNNP